jgi:hypothetical protein
MRAPARTTLLVLFLLGLVNLARGSIHAFAPDGGLESIGGFDIESARETVLFFIGAIGVSQIAAGALDLWVVLRARTFAPALLVFELLKTGGQIVESQFVKVAPNDYPGERFAIVLFAILLAAAVFEWLRPKAQLAGATDA